MFNVIFYLTNYNLKFFEIILYIIILLKMFLERSGQVNVLAAFTEPNEALKI